MVSQHSRWPQRTCLGCGARDEKDRLLRLTVDEQGGLTVDRETGRGGYLHRNPACWSKFLVRKRLYRAFRVEVSQAAKKQLINELKDQDRE